MNIQNIPLWTKETYSYPVKGDFIPTLTTYFHKDKENKRPAVIVVPGGGYTVVSPTEAEVVAKSFYNRGYHSFVLTYSTNPFGSSPLRTQPLKDLAKAIFLIKSKAEEFGVSIGQIVVCGFSAGAHLTASLATHYQQMDQLFVKEFPNITSRPAAIILSYPVITGGDRAHKPSFKALFGSSPTERELESMSLEKHVTSQTPPAFIWHTATDELVSVDNSYLFAEAYQRNGVPYECHIFADGKHGLSLANEDWLASFTGNDYTMTQLYKDVQYRLATKEEIPGDLGMYLKPGVDVEKLLRKVMEEKGQTNHINKSVAMWFDLAILWLEKVLEPLIY